MRRSIERYLKVIEHVTTNKHVVADRISNNLKQALAKGT